MSQPRHDYLDALDAAAKSAQAEEIAFRNSISAQIQRHERRRQFAFRRLGIAQLLTAPIAVAENEEAAVATASTALCNEVGWYADTEIRARILTAFRPVIVAIWAATRPLPSGGEASGAKGAAPPAHAPAVTAALAQFETWYEGEIGAPFLALLDQEIPELPVVEF